MARKKGYQVFDVPNDVAGNRFFQLLQCYINRDWYGYQRRGRGVKKGKKRTCSFGLWSDQKVDDAKWWTIYIKGLPAPKKFLENSAVKQNDEIMKLYHKEFDERVSTEKAYDDLNKMHHSLKEVYTKKLEESKQAKVKLNKYKLRLFRWNISLWREERREGHI